MWVPAFCIRNAVMSFLLVPLTGKQYEMKEHRKQFPIPFFLQRGKQKLRFAG